MKLKLLTIITLLYLNLICAQSPQSLFDAITTNNKTPDPKTSKDEANKKGGDFRFAQSNAKNKSKLKETPKPETNLQDLIDKIKEKVTNPYLKDNLNVETLANFFANFISGNEFINNLEVKELTEMSKLEVKDSLKVKGESSMEILNVNKLKTKALTIDDNEIIFDSEAKIKMKNSKLEFEVRDLFEVITFMKYIVQICGSRLERCDFNHLIKNYTVNKLKAEVEKIQEKEKKEEQEEKMKQTKLEENKKEVKEVRRDNLRKKNELSDSTAIENSEDALFLTKNEDQLNLNNPLLNDYNQSFDYERFLKDPTVNGLMNNYYYNISG